MDEADGMWRMTARLLRPGKPEARREMSAPACDGPAVVRKRMMRRHAKLCLYRLLRDETGLRPPWGALTGVRPSRLFRQLMDEGRGLNEALGYFTGELDVSADRASLVAAVLEAQRGRIVFGDDRAVDVYVGIPSAGPVPVLFIRQRGPVKGRALGGRLRRALLREIDEGAALLRDLGKGFAACTWRRNPHGDRHRSAADRPAANPHPLGRRLRVHRGGRGGPIAGREYAVHDRRLRRRRISVNPKPWNVDTLRRIGRDHTPDDVLRTEELASRCFRRRQHGSYHGSARMRAG
jgi:oxygen-independent coproporphyrinogen-3 oxidase